MFLSYLKSSLALKVLAVSALISVVVAAECTRDALLAIAEKYVATQHSGKLDDLRKLFAGSNFTYQEINQIMELQKGVLSKPLEVEYSRSTADTVACARIHFLYLGSTYPRTLRPFSVVISLASRPRVMITSRGGLRHSHRKRHLIILIVKLFT